MDFDRPACQNSSLIAVRLRRRLSAPQAAAASIEPAPPFSCRGHPPPACMPDRQTHLHAVSGGRRRGGRSWVLSVPFDGLAVRLSRVLFEQQAQQVAAARLALRVRRCGCGTTIIFYSLIIF
jgi:hypothetical protein